LRRPPLEFGHHVGKRDTGNLENNEEVENKVRGFVGEIFAVV
jgi:hypothetical protein